ncbi:hypothetical protein FRC00_008349, partial [Tulasnella sp. 408]
MAKSNPDVYLFGVEGDISLVVEELGVRTTKTVYVITDVNVQVVGDRTRIIAPKPQDVASAFISFIQSYYKFT